MGEGARRNSTINIIVLFYLIMISIHRDLKPENVLLDATGNLPPLPSLLHPSIPPSLPLPLLLMLILLLGHCVLTDFGFAKENVLTPESCSSFCGTLEYMGKYTKSPTSKNSLSPLFAAPEVVKKSKYGKPAGNFIFIFFWLLIYSYYIFLYIFIFSTGHTDNVFRLVECWDPALRHACWTGIAHPSLLFVSSPSVSPPLSLT